MDPERGKLAKKNQDLSAPILAKVNVVVQQVAKDNGYDYIIIDTSPSVGILTSNAMIAATELVVPIQASYFALKGIENIMETYTTIKERVNEDLRLLGVVVTMVDMRKRHPRDVIDDLEEIFPTDLIFRTTIREVAKVEASPGYHQDIFAFAPTSKGAEDFGNLVEEIIERCRNS